MTSRDELRSFGANLVLGVDTLFFGSAFFIYVFRRRAADEWRAAWVELEWIRPALLGCVLLLGALPVLHRLGRTRSAVLLGLGAVAALLVAANVAPSLALPGGSRAPQIAFGFFTLVFAVHAAVLTVTGMRAGANPVFRRFLWLQAGFALLILPLVFCW
jgi:hypothetical protein